MARQFATGDSLTVSAGGAAGSSNAHTVVAVVQIVGTPGSNASLLQGLASSTRVWSIIFDANKPFGLDDFGSGGPTLTSNTWYVVAVGKASGSQPYQYHVAPLSTGVWSHVNSGFNVGNGSGGTTSIQFGVSQTTGGNVAVAAVAEFAGNLSNAAVEALGVTSMDTWLAASPRAAWQFNQASTSDAVTDLTGGGADQTAISGTTVVTDPAGWSYSTGGGGEVTGSASTAATFTATAAGTPTVLGSAATAATFTATGSGTRSTAGTAATAITFTATAVQGTQTVDGTAATTLTFTATATGTPTVPGSAVTAVTVTATAAGTRTVFGTAALAAVFAASIVTVATRGAGPGTTQSTRTGHHTSSSRTGRHVETTRR